MDPVTLGLCSQIDLDLEVERASRGRPLPTAEELGNTLQPATATEGLDYNFQRDEEEKQIDADAVFKKLSSLKSAPKDEDEDDHY
ncbi:hypothetical protein D3C87_1495360 [compost metagenome]|jgi:hypothetical protein